MFILRKFTKSKSSSPTASSFEAEHEISIATDESMSLLSLGQFNEAIERLQNSISTLKKAHLLTSLTNGKIHSQIAFLYRECGKFSESHRYHYQAIEYFTKTTKTHPSHLIEAYINEAETYLEEDRHSEAQECLDNAMKTYTNSNEDPLLLALIKVLMAQCFLHTSEEKTALTYLNEANEMYNDLNRPEKLSKISFAYAQYYFKVGEFQAASRHLMTFILNGDEVLLRERIYAHALLAICYLNIGNDSAQSYIEKAYDMSKNLYSGKTAFVITRTLRSMAEFAFRGGDINVANQKIREAIKNMRENNEERHFETAQAYKYQAFLHQQQGKALDAQAALNSALQIKIFVLSKTHDQVGEIYYDMGILQRELGQPKDAFNSFTMAKRAFKAWYNINHVKVAKAYIQLALADLAREKMSRMEKTFKKAMRVFFANLERSIPLTLATYPFKELSTAALANENLEKIVIDYLPSLQVYKDSLKESKELTGMAKRCIEEVYSKKKKQSELAQKKKLLAWLGL